MTTVATALAIVATIVPAIVKSAMAMHDLFKILALFGNRNSTGFSFCLELDTLFEFPRFAWVPLVVPLFIRSQPLFEFIVKRTIFLTTLLPVSRFIRVQSLTRVPLIVTSKLSLQTEFVRVTNVVCDIGTDLRFHFLCATPDTMTGLESTRWPWCFFCRGSFSANFTVDLGLIADPFRFNPSLILEQLRINEKKWNYKTEMQWKDG